MGKRVPSPCICGADGHTNGMKLYADGTKKRRYKCRTCGNHWMVAISGPGASVDEHDDYPYSTLELERLRKSARMGGLT
jgi:transposase-like protein